MLSSRGIGGEERGGKESGAKVSVNMKPAMPTAARLNPNCCIRGETFSKQTGTFLSVRDVISAKTEIEGPSRSLRALHRHHHTDAMAVLGSGSRNSNLTPSPGGTTE